MVCRQTVNEKSGILQYCHITIMSYYNNFILQYCHITILKSQMFFFFKDAYDSVVFFHCCDRCSSKPIEVCTIRDYNVIPIDAIHINE